MWNEFKEGEKVVIEGEAKIIEEVILNGEKMYRLRQWNCEHGRYLYAIVSEHFVVKIDEGIEKQGIALN